MPQRDRIAQTPVAASKPTKARDEGGHPLNLLDLPVDILSLILQPLLTFAAPIDLCPCASASPFSPASGTNPLPILLSHPAIYAIARPLLYSPLNTFSLNTCRPHSAHLQRILADPPGALLAASEVSPPLVFNQPALRSIAVLTLRFDRLREWMLEHILPLAADMAVRGSLLHLRVVIQMPSKQFTTSTAHVSAAGLSCRPLLALLADPYLRTSQLAVDCAHAAEWCRFHDESEPCSRTLRDYQLLQEQNQQEQRAHAAEQRRQGRVGDDDPLVVRIDWRRIVREMDPEGRELVPAWAEDESARSHV
ncbi:hypothetical protein S40293_07860 [Stachybotrys chartarum IBT 40293]|nr:hypothetical protein S40293_07860 [Stachybotrys chartarum IBT 40293]